MPAERTKTLTALANAEPIVGIHAPRVQSLQWFLAESPWDAAALNARRVALLRQDPATAPDADGVLVIDATGDRKWGTKTAHIGRQYLGSIGTVDSGVVTVSSLWAAARVSWPLPVAPFTPKQHFAKGMNDPADRTKPRIAVELVQQAVADGIPGRAVVADSFYGEHETFRTGLVQLGVGSVLGLRPSPAWWALADQVNSLHEAACMAAWDGADAPGDGQRVERRFRDGHTEPWWALAIRVGPYGPDRRTRAVVATTDPAMLPEHTTWYLATNRPVPDTERAQRGPLPTADLAEIVRLDGLRNWVEQSYTQVKAALGWSAYQVRGDRAMRRHWALVWCACSFCWWADPVAAGSPPASLPHRRRRSRSRFGGKSGRRPDRAAGRSCRGRWRCARCARGWNPGSCSGATGAVGPRRPRPHHARHSSMRSRAASPSPSMLAPDLWQQRTGILLWHDAEGMDPYWGPMQLPDDRGKYYPVVNTYTHFPNKPIYGQWFIENIADPAHLKHVHLAPQIPSFGDYRWNGPNWGAQCNEPRPRLGTQGVSMIVTKGHPTQIPLGDYDHSEQISIAAVTPVDECVTDVFLSTYIVKEEGYPDEVGPRALKALRTREKNVALDFTLLDTMVYFDGPVWPPEESKMWNDVRKWCRQFYPVDTGIRHVAPGGGPGTVFTRQKDVIVGGQKGRGPAQPFNGGRRPVVSSGASS